MTQLFKKGDRVICIDDTNFKNNGPEDRFCPHRGDIGEVLSDQVQEQDLVWVTFNNLSYGWYPYHWKLLGGPQDTKAVQETNIPSLSRIQLILEEKAHGK